MSFSTFLIIGVFIGLLEVYRQASDIPRERITRVDDAIVLLMFALAGARLVYTLIRWPYFSQHLTEIPRIWLGGLDWPGSVIGSLLAIGLIGFLHKGSSRRQIADGLLPILCPVAVFCWLGAWFQNEAYGLPVSAGAWFGYPIVDSTGQTITRFPLQPVAAFFIIAVCAIGQRLSENYIAPGRKVSTGLLGFSTVMLASTFLRGDPSPLWLGYRYETWFAAAFLLIGLAGYIGTWMWQSNFRVTQTSNTI
jgi:prolipoprotein diacylglyceryltransferase